MGIRRLLPSHGPHLHPNPGRRGHRYPLHCLLIVASAMGQSPAAYPPCSREVPASSLSGTWPWIWISMLPLHHQLTEGLEVLNRKQHIFGGSFPRASVRLQQPLLTCQNKALSGATQFLGGGVFNRGSAHNIPTTHLMVCFQSWEARNWQLSQHINPNIIHCRITLVRKVANVELKKIERKRRREPLIIMANNKKARN